MRAWPQSRITEIGGYRFTCSTTCTLVDLELCLRRYGTTTLFAAPETATGQAHTTP
jgi:hypothetical protein